MMNLKLHLRGNSYPIIGSGRVTAEAKNKGTQTYWLEKNKGVEEGGQQ